MEILAHTQKPKHNLWAYKRHEIKIPFLIKMEGKKIVRKPPAQEQEN